MILLVSNDYAQVIEKDGVFFRNFILNPDSNVTLKRTNNFENQSLSEQIVPSFLKNDFMVNTLSGEYGCVQWSPGVAMDGYGNYAFAWIDERNDKTEIYAQFFNSSGNRIGSNLKVNDGDLFGNNSPFIAANKEGDFVIAWLQSFSTVVAQRFNNTGQKIGDKIIVNTTSGYNTMEPCIAIDEDGSFMIMWASEKGDWNYTVYARLIDKLGNPVGSEIIVNESQNNISSIGQGKHISVDGDGNYCLTWSSYGGTSRSNIYLQLINRNGALLGNNLLVNDPNDTNSLNTFPQISSAGNNNFMIAWNINSGTSTRIYNQNYGFITGVNSFVDNEILYPPFTISSDRDSIFFILLNGSGNYFIQKIKSNGEFLGDTTRVKIDNDNLGYIYSSDMTDIINGKFFITYTGYEKSDLNIYAQEFDWNINAIGLLQKINDDVASSAQREPIVKFNNLGQLIVIWKDSRNGNNDLYAQVYDDDFNPVNGNIQVNNVIMGYSTLLNKEVQTFSDGTFVITFTTSDLYSINRIFLQTINNRGEKIGDNILVEDKLYNNQYELAMNVNSNDELLLCWYYRYGAYLKRFDRSLTPLYPEKNFLKSTNTHGYQPFTISVDTALNIFAVWKPLNLSTYDSENQIYGQFFDKLGTAGSDKFLIDSTNSYIMQIKCMNNGNENYAIVYKDQYKYYIKRMYKLDKEYEFIDRFESSGYSSTNINIVKFDNKKFFTTYNNYNEVIGFFANDNRHTSKIYNLHFYDFINPYYNRYNGINGADIYNDKLFFAYESNRNGGTGSDIWANVRLLENINFNPELFYLPVNSDYLYNNFPNPFNPNTKIIYELLAYHKVKLTVFDILGREVRVLVDENQEKGIYEVDFNASGLASGVYFYKLDAFNTSIKKMILLR